MAKALQAKQTGLEERGHTGWREIDGKWIYLSGATTGSDDFEVDLGTELSRYKLPGNIDDPIEAMRRRQILN